MTIDCALHCFPTRRSSDLADAAVIQDDIAAAHVYARANLFPVTHGFTLPLSEGALHDLLRFTDDALQVLLVRSEEHTSELQSRGHLVCRLLLEKKKKHSDH